MPECPELRAAWLGLALSLAAGCGAHEEPAAAAENPLAPSEGRAKYSVDALGSFARVATPEALEAALPELPFEERSDGLPPSGAWNGPPLLADLTANGHADLVASSCEDGGYACWLAPEPGIAWQRRDDTLPRGLGCGAACSADLDRDGHADLVLSTSERGLRIFLGDGALGWREAPLQPAETPPVADLEAGDFDGDGLADLAGIGYPHGGLKLFFGEPGGSLRPAPAPALLPENAFGRALELADLDLDGRDDIAVATDAGLRVFLTEPGAEPRWREASAGLPVRARPDSLRAVCSGRFRADPRPQLAVCSQPDPTVPLAQRDTIGVYAWNAATNSWEHVDSGLPRGDRYADLAAADLDGDGKLDLVTLSLEHGAAIWLGDGQGGFRAQGRLAGVHGRGRLALGHVDSNLLIDIVVAVPAGKDNPEGGGVRAFLNRRPAWAKR
jgi:hypothetical protein